jgi:hypothetical protein
MKITSIVALVAVAVMPALAAHMEHGKKEIKLLKDSAAALSSISPDLSGRLKEYAAKETEETEKSEAARSESSAKDDIKLLKDSAAALKSTRPDLAKGLKKFADKESREAKRESSEKERPAPMGTQQENQTPSPGY